MDREARARTVARLRQLLAQGQSLRRCAQALGLSKSALQRRLRPGEIERLRTRRIPGQRRTPRERQRAERLIREGRQTLARIAAICATHKGTISRQARQLMEQGDPELKQLTFRTRRVRGARRCPVHGPVRTWPCVACAALAARRSPT